MTANLSPAESAVLAAIDEDALGATLLELLAIPSVTGAPPSPSASTCSPGGSTGWASTSTCGSMDLPELTATGLPGHRGAHAARPPLARPRPRRVRRADRPLGTATPRRAVRQ